MSTVKGDNRLIHTTISTLSFLPFLPCRRKGEVNQEGMRSHLTSVLIILYNISFFINFSLLNKTHHKEDKIIFV